MTKNTRSDGLNTPNASEFTKKSCFSGTRLGEHHHNGAALQNLGFRETLFSDRQPAIYVKVHHETGVAELSSKLQIDVFEQL